MRAASSSSLNNRLKTIIKKAYELSVLCEIEVCVIYYGPDGRLKTWPRGREKVKDMALRYKTATKRKKSLNLHEFMEKEMEKKKPKTNLKKKKKNLNGFKYPVWYPIFDRYSPNQLSQLILSLEQTLSILQERLRFVEVQKQRKTNLVHQSLTPSSLNQHHHQYQTQPLNPSKFLLYMYNHGDATLSQLPLSASHPNQQLTNYQNHFMMKQQLRGLQKFQHPYVSNTQDYSALVSVQESELKNHLMQRQKELQGFDQKTVPVVFCSDFQKNPCGDMVASTSFSQDCPNMFSSNGESSLLQTSSLPYLHAIPNTYCLPENSRIL